MAERSGTSGSTPSRPAIKRMRGSPTGNTPKQPHKRQSLRRTHAAIGSAPLPRRQLSFSEREATKSHTVTTNKMQVQEWTMKEEIALVEFILFHGFNWPSTKLPQFWERAAKYLEQTCGTQRRTSECMMFYLSSFLFHDYC